MNPRTTKDRILSPRNEISGCGHISLALLASLEALRRYKAQLGYPCQPQPGLLEIRSKDWDASDLDHEPGEFTGIVHFTFEGKVPVSILFEEEGGSR